MNAVYLDGNWGTARRIPSSSLHDLLMYQEEMEAVQRGQEWNEAIKVESSKKNSNLTKVATLIVDREDLSTILTALAATYGQYAEHKFTIKNLKGIDLGYKVKAYVTKD